MLLGFWVFVYNLGQTLRSTSQYDVTERHFWFALAYLILVTTFGFLLALDFVTPVFALLSVSRRAVVSAHVTLAVFGVVLTTILGALYQLGTMFTQTKLHGVDIWLRRGEEAGYPAGVVLLATGRLVDSIVVAQVGGILVIVTLFGFSIVLARRLAETSVEWNPMLSRYAVVTVAVALWSALALPSWLRDPLASDTLFGAPSTFSLLVVGVVGFVVFGTLYHVVPFIVWVHRYSDLLGLEPVPMVDDLYSDRLARLDFALLLVGTIVLVASDVFSLSVTAAEMGLSLFLVGSVVFVTNVLQVIRVHSPHSVVDVLFTARPTDGTESTGEVTGASESR